MVHTPEGHNGSNFLDENSTPNDSFDALLGITGAPQETTIGESSEEPLTFGQFLDTDVLEPPFDGGPLL